MESHSLALLGQGAFYCRFVWEGEGTGERDNIRRGLARLLWVINKCACTCAQSPISAFLSICVSRIACVLVFFFIMKAFQAPELPLLQFSFLIGPRCPYGNNVKPWVYEEPISCNFSACSNSVAQCQETGTRTDHNKHGLNKPGGEK